MIDSRKCKPERIEPAKDDQVDEEAHRPARSYYYDDAAGYEIYDDDQDESDEISESQSAT